MCGRSNNTCNTVLYLFAPHKHTRVRFVNFEKINLEYSLGKNAPTAFKPTPGLSLFFCLKPGK